MGEAEMMAIVEAILFVSDEAVSLSKISGILGIERKDAQKLLDSMIERFKAEGRGLKILKADDTYKLATCPSCKEHVERFTGKTREKGLSSSCLETLSVIAYHQPVTRMDIEGLKGANCAHSLTVLLKNGFIKEAGRLKAIGRPILYGTTDHFLRTFGLSSLKELPALEEKR
jgi:segregation and condensation protein B